MENITSIIQSIIIEENNDSLIIDNITITSGIIYDNNITFNYDTPFIIKIFAILTLIILTLIGGFANAAVLLVFIRRPALRNRSNKYVMNLLSINIISCILLSLLVSLHFIFLCNIQWTCIITEAVIAGVCASSALGVLLIAADQYRAIIKPLQYHATRSIKSKHLAAIFMLFTWLGGILSGSLSIVNLNYNNTFLYDCNLNLNFLPLVHFRKYFSIFYTIFTLIIPVITLCWFYGCIYKEAHKNSKRARRNGSTHECSENNIVNIQPLLVSPPSTNRIVSSLKHRISNASLFKYREEARAARISFLVIFMSIICWGPYCIILILRTIFHMYIEEYIIMISIILLSCTSIVSPALFAYRSRRLQREVKRLLLCKSSNTYLPNRHNFLTRNRWRKRAALAAVAAATLVNIPEKPTPPPTQTLDNNEICNNETSLINNPTDTSRSSFSSGTTQGTNSTDIE